MRDDTLRTTKELLEVDVSQYDEETATCLMLCQKLAKLGLEQDSVEDLTMVLQSGVGPANDAKLISPHLAHHLASLACTAFLGDRAGSTSWWRKWWRK